MDGESETDGDADFGENKVLSVRVREVLVLGVLSNDSRCLGIRMRRDSVCRWETTLGGEGGSETREEREETTSDDGDETLRLTGVEESTEESTWRLGGCIDRCFSTGMRPTRDWVHVISCGTFTPRRDLCGGRGTGTSTAPSTRDLDRVEGASGRRYVPLR